MITVEKLEIYRRCGGSVDWYQVQSHSIPQIISDGEWGQIDGFIQDIFLVHTNQADKSFANRLNQKLKEYCDSDNTIIELRNLEEYLRKIKDNNK
ncbi:MAG TPA: hypothetical protein VN922_25020 [Bacteroidia bacterium]|nr:hypothetical protein [Bacteroidia bacterium]